MLPVRQLANIIRYPHAVNQLRILYGQDPGDLAFQQDRHVRLADLFRQQFPGQETVRLFSTPGRTEVGGNHTDHQHGCVLCAAVDLDIIALAAPNPDHVIRLKSEGFPDMDCIDLNQLEPIAQEREHSASLIRGIAAGFARRGLIVGGLDIYTTSRVPKGSGLSSSAAFEVLVATILDCLYNGNQVSAVDRAIIAQYAENEYFGKPSGLMDQCGCSVGGFIAIDFKKPGQPVVDALDSDFDAAGYGLIITNTGGSHADLTHEYASIPHDMGRVAGFFGKSVLRDVDQNEFWQKIPQLRRSVDDRALLRAIHFFQDNARVGAQAAALKNQDIDLFFTLVRQSGCSSWTKLQNVWSARNPEEQPIALGLAVAETVLQGRGACRVHGGGFAGTIQAFVPIELMRAYMTAMQAVFGTQASWKLRIRSTGSCEVMPAP